MSKDLFLEQCQNKMALLIEKTENGEINALRTFAQAKEMKDFFSDCEKQLKDLAISEAENYAEKEFESNGYYFKKRNGSKRFDFKHIEEWQNYQKNLKDCEKKYKAFFEAKQKGMIGADDNGEVIEMPKVSYNKDSLIVSKI